MSEIKVKRKFDFSKLKELGQMDLKDIGSLFSNKKITKILNTKIERPKNIVSFDFGSKAIKIVTGKYSNGKLAITKCLDIPTPPDAILDGNIADKKQLSDIIQFTLKEEGIRAKDAIITINSSSIINREIVIPKVEKDEIPTVIRYEIQQYLPINLNDYILQYIVLDEIIDDNGEKLKVNVISVPNKIAKDYYDLIEEIGLNPYVLDVTYNSIRKINNYLIMNQEKEEKGTVAFVDMGATSINVTIFKNGKLEFTRIIKSGGDNIDYALSLENNMSIKSTESLKIKEADLYSDTKVNKVVKKSVDEMLDDLERIFKFYNNKSVGNEINKIYIYGGTSNLLAIEKYMSERLNINVEKLSILDNVEFKNKELTEQTLEQYLNAIGAIIRI